MLQLRFSSYMPLRWPSHWDASWPLPQSPCLHHGTMGVLRHAAAACLLQVKEASGSADWPLSRWASQWLQGWTWLDMIGPRIRVKVVAGDFKTMWICDACSSLLSIKPLVEREESAAGCNPELVLSKASVAMLAPLRTMSNPDDRQLLKKSTYYNCMCMYRYKYEYRYRYWYRYRYRYT